MAGTGRRERNKAEKRDRIVRAAAALFRDRGYAHTTTQQVAADADVADGTVFRYAGSKPELLLMVLNERLAARLATADAAGAPGAEEGVLALLAPWLELLEEQPANAAPYLREVLFGEDGPHRRAALGLVEASVDALADLLAPRVRDLPGGMDAREAARWVFGALVTEVLRDIVGARNPGTRTLLRARVRVLLRGLGVDQARDAVPATQVL